jgi:CHAT domain-containing protein
MFYVFTMGLLENGVSSSTVVVSHWFVGISASTLSWLVLAGGVTDYVVSSYTPTLSVLLAKPPHATPDTKVMVAIHPETPGCSPLPYTREELLRIESIIQSQNLIKLGGVGDPVASVENVLSHLLNVYIAHFSCHGRQNMVNPLESSLILDGGEKLKISQIMEKPMSKASLAFLSVCETGMGAEDLPDEAIHLAASMLFAGFRGVVATMW